MLSRRQLLLHGTSGLGYLALANLTTDAARADQRPAAYRRPLEPKAPHLPARAKRVILMFMQGGPSHIDTFDHKPELTRLAGKTIHSDASPKNGRRIEQLMPSPWAFHRRGESGLAISELFPHLSEQADKICLLNGMHTDNPAHPQSDNHDAHRFD